MFSKQTSLVGFLLLVSGTVAFPQTAGQLNTGVYSLTANIFALGLKSSF